LIGNSGQAHALIDALAPGEMDGMVAEGRGSDRAMVKPGLSSSPLQSSQERASLLRPPADWAAPTKGNYPILSGGVGQITNSSV
jgi:hypothetical protein